MDSIHHLCNKMNLIKSVYTIVKFTANWKEIKTSSYLLLDTEIEAWKPEDGTNVWELSGLFEGDIMLYTKQPNKNGIIDETYRWPNATIPYYIDEAFSEWFYRFFLNIFQMCQCFENNNGFSPFFCTANEEVVSILNAMQEYHDKTCIRFRPFVKTDEHWIDIKQDWSGCWSSVGMKKQGQIVNLGSDKCRKHGYIIMLALT